ncbi:MAG: protein-glutamate O-methyltransferase CheR [Terriglobales bacterium]|jgi:chemotaxis protein methyltransferase CheR
MAIEIANAQAAVTPDSNPGDPAYLKIRDLIYRISGIYHSEGKLYLLVSRCARRMIALGVTSPAEYLEHLTTRGNRDAELRLLLNEITIGETYMFRHPAQLDALRNVILPQILESKGSAGLKRLRFWCAGCSTGEEPHTLAMFLLEEKEKLLAGWSFDILATDLNDNSLEIARAGVYGEYALRKTSGDLRRKYFKDAGDKKLQANDLLKSQIRFDRINLRDDSKMLFQKGLDVIFCCNVLIYFDLASKRRVVQHFYASLLPGGYLFLGHAESLFQVDDSFRLVHFTGTTAYGKPAPAAAGGVKK